MGGEFQRQGVAPTPQHGRVGGRGAGTASCPAGWVSAALLCLSCASRDEVDRLGAAALAAGGRELHGADDRGFMYGRAFDDLDGHGWEVMYMDANAMPAEQHDAAVPA